MSDHQYQVGQKVLWRGGFGGDPEKLATIIGFDEKNGRPLADLDNGHWAYLTQLRPLNSHPNLGTW